MELSLTKISLWNLLRFAQLYISSFYSYFLVKEAEKERANM